MDNYVNIPLDTNKRHFVVGDIHGRYETFLNLLEAINYDDTTDIIYSVGDLIDRGTQSVETVKFFQQPNNHAVLGNHEQMINDPDQWKSTWLYPPNGGPATLHSLKQHDLELSWLENFCETLPICLDVGSDTQDGAFRLIHAELPPTLSEVVFRWVLSITNVADGDLLWGRETISAGLRNIKVGEDIDHNIKFDPDRSGRNIFCGHTPTNKIYNIGDIWWIDTYGSRTMSMMNALTLEQFSVPVVLINPD